MPIDELKKRLTDKHGSESLSADSSVKDGAFLLKSGSLVDVMRSLRDDEGFDCLSNLSGVDYKDQGYVQVVYHLYSYKSRESLVLKANADREKCELPSVAPVWNSADWMEREVYDLLGVKFSGHPDLRRILMPEDWVGHPLRKDFVEPEEYHGINTRRESLIR